MDSEIGFFTPEQISPALNALSKAEPDPVEMGIAISNGGVLVISGNDKKLLDHLKSIGITPKSIKIDVCG
jgi:hypothetical protein